MVYKKPSSEAMTDAEITLTILISCYNTRNITADCLHSIYQNPPSETYEIILVDDASNDGTSEMVRSEFPNVRLLHSEINRHYAHSNNWGLDNARGRYVLLLNNDTIIVQHALDLMIAFLREHPEAGTVGCKLLNEDGSIQWSVKSLPSPYSAIAGARSYLALLAPNNYFSRQHLLHLSHKTQQPFVAGYVSSAACMMPIEVIRRVGPLDPLFTYHVDADYCKRISDAGFLCYYLPTATIIHLNHKGGTMATLSVRFRHLLLFEVQSYRYFRKHLQTSAWDLMRFVAMVGLSFHFLVLVSAQVCTEFASVLRSSQMPKRSVGAEDPTVQ